MFGTPWSNGSSRAEHNAADNFRHSLQYVQAFKRSSCSLPLLACCCTTRPVVVLLRMATLILSISVPWIADKTPLSDGRVGVRRKYKTEAWELCEQTVRFRWTLHYIILFQNQNVYCILVQAGKMTHQLTKGPTGAGRTLFHWAREVLVHTKSDLIWDLGVREYKKCFRSAFRHARM